MVKARITPEFHDIETSSVFEIIFKRFKHDDDGFFIDVTDEAVDVLFEDIMAFIIRQHPVDVSSSALHVMYRDESNCGFNRSYTIKRNCQVTTRTITDFGR